jgi:hypothetical protein
MEVGIYVNRIKAAEWGLTLTESFIFGFIYQCLGVENQKLRTINDVVYCDIPKYLVVDKLPFVTDKVDTVYKCYKSLSTKGIISYIKIGSCDYVALTEKSKSWNINLNNFTTGVLISNFNLNKFITDQNDYLIFNNGKYNFLPRKEVIEEVITLLKNTLDDYEPLFDIFKLPVNKEEEITDPIKTKEGFVYLLFCSRTKFYKIGRARDVYKRLSQLKTANPCIELVSCAYVEDMVRMENKLHSVFSDLNVDREWFNLTSNEVQIINDFFIENKIKQDE